MKKIISIIGLFIFLQSCDSGRDLSYAIKTDNIKLLKQLIRNGADVNQYDEQDGNILLFSIKNNNLKAASILIENGANIDIFFEDEMPLITTMIGIYSIQKANELLDEKVYPELFDVIENAFLVYPHFQSLNENDLLNFIYTMIDKKVNMDPDVSKIKPICAAVYSQNANLVSKILLSKPGLELVCSDNETCLTKACLFGNWEIARLLINYGANVNGSTVAYGAPLLCASGMLEEKNGHSYYIVDMLVNGGADINYTNSDGINALGTALFNNNLDIAELLVHSGAKINSNFSGIPLIAFSILAKNYKAVELLLNYGADINKIFHLDGSQYGLGISIPNATPYLLAGNDKKMLELISNHTRYENVIPPTPPMPKHTLQPRTGGRGNLKVTGTVESTTMDSLEQVIDGLQVQVDSLIDIDGNTYKTLRIGKQIWMAENLKVTHYNDGTPIPTGYSGSEWNLPTGAYAVYNDDESNADTYGYLYNWYAVDTGNLAPEGWHVPTDEEWMELEMELGMRESEASASSVDDLRGTNQGSQLAGNADLWYDGDLENNEAFGTTGFNGLAGGTRVLDGVYSSMGYSSNFWSSTQFIRSTRHIRYATGGNYAWVRGLRFNSSEFLRYRPLKISGFAVRCVKN